MFNGDENVVGSNVECSDNECSDNEGSDNEGSDNESSGEECFATERTLFAEEPLKITYISENNEEDLITFLLNLYEMNEKSLRDFIRYLFGRTTFYEYARDFINVVDDNEIHVESSFMFVFEEYILYARIDKTYIPKDIWFMSNEIYRIKTAKQRTISKFIMVDSETRKKIDNARKKITKLWTSCRFVCIFFKFE